MSTNDEVRQEGAGEILRRRYVGDDPARVAAIAAERINAEVAQMIYDRRQAAGLTQKELAKLVGTTQSVISRLEDADYEGHSLSMLQRIAEALDQRVIVRMTEKDSRSGVIRFVFREIMRGLRRRKGLSVDDLARALDEDREEIAAIERVEGYLPSSSLLDKLSRFYRIPQQRLAELAGVAARVEPGLAEQASRFAAKSDSFARLTPEESRVVDDFVKFLRAVV